MSLAKSYPRLGKLFTLGLLPQMLFAQVALHAISTQNGLYTAEQAQQGKAIYQSQCAMCHGETLEGQGRDSPLTGPAFLNHWTGRTVASLFMKTIVMMPAPAPGTLTPKQTADVLAYILSANRFPAGKTELPSQPLPLERITISNP